MKMLMAGLAVVRKEGNINNEKTCSWPRAAAGVRNQRESSGGWQNEKLERIRLAT